MADDPGPAILAGAVLFALPHLGDSLTGPEAIAYVITGIAFGLVYVLTGFMTAAMMSHVLQSWYAFGQILVFGRGDASVSPIIWILILGCPLWVYLCARGLHAVFPKGRASDSLGV
ncbi:CPBP family glutamic-type intramembrane protease [Mariniluteicoccus flavus]